VQNAAQRADDEVQTSEASLGYWIFRNRSWLPVPLVIALVAVKPQAIDPRAVYAGALCIVVGESLRLWAVRHIGVVSRTRSLIVGPLITSGPYAHTRNPLYVGNWLLWTGFALGSSLRWMLPLSWVVFAVQHAIVVHWEEQLLSQRFAASYPRYVREVPRWWLRLAAVKRLSAPYPWSSVLFSERGTLLAIVLVALLLVLRRLIG